MPSSFIDLLVKLFNDYSADEINEAFEEMDELDGIELEERL